MRALLLMVLMGLSMAGHAVIVSDLYQVRVPVADQSAAVRQAAIQEALLQLVIKVSGSAASAQSDDIQTAAGQADRYVKSFRFVRGEDNQGLKLEVVFAQNQVDDLLRNARLPVWGKSRPLVLSWIAVEDNLQRLVVNQNLPVWRSQLEDVMGERGIPLLWPSLDLQDEVALPVERLWGLFRNDVTDASARYMADAVMAGRLAPAGEGKWAFRGFLKLKDDVLELQAEGEDSATALRQVAGQVADFMAARYAVLTEDNASGYQIQVRGVESFGQYQDVINYLNANVAVNAVRVVSVNQQELTLELDLSADWQQVWTTLALDHRLLPDEQESVYNWRH